MLVCVSQMPWKDIWPEEVFDPELYFEFHLLVANIAVADRGAATFEWKLTCIQQVRC